MPQNEEMTRVEFTSDDVGVMLLESITRGLYHNPLNSVREYVQNEFDAGAREVRITASSDKVVIVGNGTGMSREELLSARRIGYSTKDARVDVGFRGIGIWSGVAICDEVLVSTKKRSETLGHVLKIDAKGLRGDIEQGTLPLIESLSRRVSIRAMEREEFRGKQGTSVELRGLLPENLPSLDRESLLTYAQQILPVRVNPGYKYAEDVERQLQRLVKDYRTIRIFVNEREAFRPPHEAIRTIPPSFDILKNDRDETIAVAWYAISEQGAVRPDSRFLIYKKKGFTIGDTTRSNLLILKTTDRHAFAWATGEVHVLADEVVPTSERIDFEMNAAFRDLEERAKGLLDEIVRSVRKHQAGETAKERLEYVRELKRRFLAETDPEERLSIFLDGQAYLRYLEQDLQNPRLDSVLKAKARKARDQLKKDLREMANQFEAPPVIPGEIEEERKPRKPVARGEVPSAEQLAGELGAYFPFDRLSLRLLRAVIAAVNRLVGGKQARVRSFVEFLKEELRHPR